MSKMKLRTRIPTSYYEPEEPAFDEYIYCDQCQDFVYEYCSLHGPLLVIPDDEVSPNNDYPEFIPRAALTTPREFLHIAPSIIPGAGLGVFATLTLPKGVRFGPFRGRRTKQVTSQYCWKIQDRNMRYKHNIDALDPNVSNWMRYVNCARHWHEQNLVAYQYQGQIYYRTVKIIPRFTELMVFYGSEFAMALNIDMRNYNSDYFYQTIAQRKLHFGQYIDRRYLTEENCMKQSNDMDFEEVYNSTNTDDFTQTTIQNFVIIDTPEESNDSKSHTNGCMVPEPHTRSSECATGELPQTLEYTNECMISESHTRSSECATDEQPQTLQYTNECMISESHTISYKSQTVVTSKVLEHFNNLTCFVCNKSFAVRYNLKRHYKTHGINTNDINTAKYSYNPKPNNYQNATEVIPQLKKTGFECDICQKTFRKSYNLKRHRKMHDIEKTQNSPTQGQFKCNVCDKNLRSKRTLVSHMYIHTGKPLQCTQCPYKTSLSHEFRDHIKSHMIGNDVYKCDMCSYSCNVRRYIVYHLQKRHK